MKKLHEGDPIYKFIHLDGLAKNHEALLNKGEKLELPGEKGEKIVIDQYKNKDGTVHMEVMEKDRDKISKTSFKLEKRYVGIDSRHLSGFKEMLTINHTLLDSKSNTVTFHNTKLDFSRGKIIEQNISEIKDRENKEIFQKEAEYLRDYFVEIEKKEEKKKSGIPLLLNLFKKQTLQKEESHYKENFEKILQIARKYKGKLDQGQHIEFNLSSDTTIVIDKYKPDLKATELNVLEKKAGKLSRIDYKMEKTFIGASGFSDTCYSKALLTVNHTLLNTRDKSVQLKETQVDCLGGHIKEIHTKEIKRTDNKELYEKHADYIRGYLAELTSYDKQKKIPFLKKFLGIKDKNKIDEHVKSFAEVKEILTKEKITGDVSAEGKVINLSPYKKLILEEEYYHTFPKSFHIIEKHKKGVKKIEYELEKRYIGGEIMGETGFMQILSVNTTLLDTKDKILSFIDAKIDIDHRILIESHKEIIKKSEIQDIYEHYEENLLDESSVCEDIKSIKQSFSSFLNKFKKGRL